MTIEPIPKTKVEFKGFEAILVSRNNKYHWKSKEGGKSIEVALDSSLPADLGSPRYPGVGVAAVNAAVEILGAIVLAIPKGQSRRRRVY